MTLASINPADGTTLQAFDAWDDAAVDRAVDEAHRTQTAWAELPLADRCDHLRVLAAHVRTEREDLARLAAREMGKPLAQARSEIDKCAWVCEYYAETAPAALADAAVATDAAHSYVAHQPLGPLLAVMPWNFPFWQVFRCLAPALAVGNTVLLKHASNVPQCALAIERLVLKAGLPNAVLRTLLIPGAAVERWIADPRIRAVTLTGSEATGRAVAAAAGAALKPTVLELGGSDPFIVLADADLEHTVAQAVTARFQNTGQSCIAAKRFIVEEAVADAFVARFTDAVAALRCGDPLDEHTFLGPLARRDLRDALHRQVQDSLAAGAVRRTGGECPSGPGAYYPPTLLDRVAPGMPAYDEELFGPVAAVVRVPDADAAVACANATRFGLGGSVWTRDARRGETVARALQCGNAFVNSVVKSDPRLPFGGVKDSGYGRELSHHGLLAFANVKTVWIQ